MTHLSCISDFCGPLLAASCAAAEYSAACVADQSPALTVCPPASSGPVTDETSSLTMDMSSERERDKELYLTRFKECLLYL